MSEGPKFSQSMTEPVLKHEPKPELELMKEAHGHSGGSGHAPEPQRLEMFVDAACAMVATVLIIPLVQQLVHVQEADAAYRRADLTPSPAPILRQQVLNTPQPLADVPLGIKLLQVTYNNLQVVMFTAFLLSYHNYMNLWLRKTDRWLFLSATLFFCIVPLWPILVKSIVDGGFPSPYSLLFNGVLWIGVALLMILTHAWSSKFNTNPAFAGSRYNLQFVFSFSGMILVGILYIIVGSVTMNMVEPIAGSVNLVQPTRLANIVIALTSYPGFWLPFIISFLFWFTVKVPYLNDSLPSGWDLRYNIIRLEVFTDAVVAVGVFILAIEFANPIDISIAEYKQRIPDVFLFFLTVSVIMFHWYWHNKMTHWLKAIDIPTFWLNILFCFFVVNVPFALKLVFMGGRTGDKTALDICTWYAFVMLILLSATHALLHFYCLRKKSTHKDNAHTHGAEVVYAFIGIGSTALVTIIVRGVAYSNWQWTWAVFGLIPLINTVLLFLPGQDKDHGHAKKDTDLLAYYYMPEKGGHGSHSSARV